MWDKIVEYMAANGVWALLFLGLLVYQLMDSRKREEKYTITINSLTESLNALEGIKQDIKSIIETIDGTTALFGGRKKKSVVKTEETEPTDTEGDK